MKSSLFIFSLCFLLNIVFIEARQYEEGYLFEIIESNNSEEVSYFFDNHPHFVKKTKHILEFIEAFRQELGKRFGYIPTWKEIYDAYKQIMPSLDIPSHDKQHIKEILKSIAKKTEQKELEGFRCNSLSIDFRGSLDIDDSMPEPIAIATSEALAGVLLCLIDNPVARGIGGWMIADSGSRICSYYTDKKSKDFVHNPLERETASSGGESERTYDPPDYYDRLTDSQVR